MSVRLSSLSKFQPVALVCLGAMLNACSLPAVKPRIAPNFEEGKVEIKTLSILPVDLGVTKKTRSGLDREKPATEQKLGKRMLSGITRAFQRRGYDVKSVFQADGSLGGVRLVESEELAAIRVEIHRTSQYPAIEEGVYLPEFSGAWIKYLGEKTGTDASVYVRGWAYVDPSSGSSVGTVFAILFVVVILVVLLAAVSKRSKSKKSKSTCSRRSGKSRGRRHAYQPRRATGHLKKPPKYSTTKPRCRKLRTGRSACSPARNLARGMHHTTQILAEAASEVDVNIHVHPPGEYPVEQPYRPDQQPEQTQTWAEIIERQIKEGPKPLPAESALGIAISLVHNQTGQILWHGEQRFDIEANGHQLQDLMEHFLEKMPGAT